MEKVIGLCKGRHEIKGVEEYIFPNEVNPLDLNAMNIQIHEALKDADAVRLYVTGLTVACTQVISYCISNLMPITLMHFNRDNGEYYPQTVLSYDQVFTAKFDYGMKTL